MAIKINGKLVAGMGGGIAGVTSFNGRTGEVVPQEGDYTAEQVGAIPVVQGTEGQFLGFTGENMIGAVPAPKSSGKRTSRFVVGTSTAGWTTEDCDYLCDGTDDQVEINAAIQALPAEGGEVVILDGTYNITANIEVNKGHTKLRGNGHATVLKVMKSSVEIINITKDYCTIENLMCDGNKTSFTSTYGIFISSGSNNTITGNTCNNNNNYGISISSGSNNTITGNTCNNNGNYGISISSGSNNTITGNTCNSNNNTGIYINNSSNNTITGNTCNNNNTGIYVSSNSNNTITGNTCNNNGNTGIYIYSRSNNTITGNTCNNNNYGISISSGSNNTITGNTCNSNNNTGIYINNSSNNTITGNTCIRGTGTSGDYTSSQNTIYVTGGKNNLVTGNNCMGKAPTDSGTNNTLANNKY